MSIIINGSNDSFCPKEGDAIVEKAFYTLSKHSICLMHAVGLRTSASTRKLRLRRAPVYVLYYVVRGSGTLRMGGETILFAKQQLYLIPPHSAAVVTCHAESVEYYVMSFSFVTGRLPSTVEQHSREIREEPALLPAGALPLLHPPQICRLIEKLYQESCGQCDEFRIQLRFQELLIALLQQLERTTAAHSSERSIELTIDFMERNFHEKLDVKRLSEMAGLTLSSFSRLFKQVKGTSPTEYLAGIRMESAKRMLEQNRYKIKDVASAVGYRDEFYFSHMFHHMVGVSPTLYMKQTRMKVAVASCLQFSDCLRSLGLEPVSSVNCFRYPGMSEEEYEHIYRSRMDELRAAKPDLIICDRHHGRFETEFKSLASQVVLLKEMDWRDNYEKIAEILGLQAEMDNRLQELEMRTAAARRQLQSALRGESFIVIQVTHLGIRLQGMVGHPLNELLYSELGLLPGKNMPMSTASLELAPEWLPQLEADRLLIHMNHLRAGSEQIYARMKNTHVWQTIRAVQHKQVHFIPNWFRMSWSPSGREAVLEELLELTGAAELAGP